MARFVLGWPEWLEVIDPPDLNGSTSINILSNPKENLLISTTTSTISLWSCGPLRQRLVLHSLSDDIIDKYGLMVRGAIWSPDSWSFAVLTSDGHVAIFALGGDALTYLIDEGLKDSIDAESITISLAGIIIPPENSRATSIADYAGNILIGTSSGTLITFTWDGDVIMGKKDGGMPLLVPLALHMQSTDSVISTSGTRNLGLVDLTVARDEVSGLTLVGFVCADGRSGLALEEGRGDSSGAGISERLRGFILPSSRDAVRVAATAAGHAGIAIGLARSEVLLYRCTSTAWMMNKGSDDDSLPFELACRLSLDEWGVSGTEIGPVSCLSWTQDGCALAVGWRDRGAAIFSSAGTRCMCTVPQALSGSDDVHQWLRHGAMTCCWGGGGLSLYVSSSDMHSSESSSVSIDDINFDISELPASPSIPSDAQPIPPQTMHITMETGSESSMDLVTQSESGIVVFPCFRAVEGGEQDSALLLRGEDRVIVVQFRGSGLDACPEHVVYPPKYLFRNWPIRHIAGCMHNGTSETGRKPQLAVAGKHGLCVFLSKLQKWREFGSTDQEKHVECCSLVWFRDSIVVMGSQNGSSCSLLLYNPTKENMMNGHHSAQIHLGHEEPLILASDQDSIAVLTAGSILAIYRVAVNGDDIKCTGPMISVSVDPSLPRTLSLLLLPPHILPDLPSRMIRTESESEEPKQRLPRLLVLRSDGSLVVVAGRRGRTVDVGHEVDAMWSCIGSCKHCDAIWVQRKNMVHVIEGTDAVQSTTPQLPANSEVHPLGFESRIGMVVGVTQVLTVPHTTKSQTGRFLLLVRTQPFLHTFFVHYLLNARPDMAEAVADKWHSGPHRSHFMELALRSTLDTAISTQNMVHLETAMNILREHDRFPAAVAGCARKVDVKYWESLFEYAASPIELFDRALAAGDLLACVALIPVLRRSMLESPQDDGAPQRVIEQQMHRRAVAWGLRGTLLLSALLASGDMASADDLLRFLLGPSAQEIADDHMLKRRSVLLDDVVPDEELRYAVDCVIGHRVELLLRDGSVAELVVLSTSLRRWFSLSSWLQRNWTKMSVGFELSTGLSTLHSAFAMYSSQRSREDSIGHEEPGDSSHSVVVRVVAEVEYLLDVFFHAGVFEWALCAATFLRRTDDAIVLIKRLADKRQCSVEEMWREFVAALVETGYGYQAFSKQVESKLSIAPDNFNEIV